MPAKNHVVRGDDIPDEVRQFVAAHLRSIEQLEVLLLLSRSIERAWTASEVYRAVLTNEQSIRVTLELLAGSGLVRQVSADAPSYRFEPDSDPVRNVVARLAEIYKERPARIVELLYAPPAHEMEAFARAFRIRKDK